MLSYRHGFHAGNHADVLKHLTLVALLRHFLRKDKPFIYLDSHAGAGKYEAQSPQALKTGELAAGIGRLWQQTGLHPLVEDYLAQIRRCNSDDRLIHYPGSPTIAVNLLRPDDRACLIELHNTEIEALRYHLGSSPQVAIHHRDAWEGLRALTPPTPRRGLALIDPAYEIPGDYDEVEALLPQIHRKWPVGTLALWYPLLATARDGSYALKRGLARSGLGSLLCVELAVAPQKSDFGMHGSGMLIVNPPWQLDQQLQEALPTLVPYLCEPGAPGARVEWLIQPA